MKGLLKYVKKITIWIRAGSKSVVSGVNDEKTLKYKPAVIFDSVV